MRFLSVSEVAQMSGLTPQHILLLIRTGKVQGRKAGGIWLVNEESFSEYRSQEHKPGPRPEKEEN